jgi:dolichyl-phosphate-mannose--protein O-mannosyl transferase
MQNRSRLHTSIILLLLFLAAWVPRTLALDVFVTPDERKWLTRSANFSSALVHGEYDRTFQTIHPGVTVMWAGALGMAQRAPGMATQIIGQVTEDGFETWLEENNGPTPLDLLTAGRWWIALTISLGIALAFLPLRALFGAPAAILATLLMAWDPFFLALSRQLHIDGLLTTFLTLSLLTLLAWLYAGRRTRYLSCRRSSWPWPRSPRRRRS